MADETGDQLPEQPSSGDSGSEGAQDGPTPVEELESQVWENASEIPLVEDLEEVELLVGNELIDLEDMLAMEAHTPGCIGGCLRPLVYVWMLAIIGIVSFLAIQSGWFGFTGSTNTENDQAQSGSSLPSESSLAPEGGVDWIPRDGTWEIENLPFLPGCGPGSLGSGFQEGTIEVIDEGASIVATGSQPGTASIELSLRDASPGRLLYLGVEPVTGLEMTMVFTSPTEMEASVRSGGEVCLERPAAGEWDRQTGEPDPDAAGDGTMPDWMPAGFPVSGGGEVNTVETPTSKTVTVVVRDTHPTDVLFSIAEWAVDEGHPILERSATTLTIDLPENQVMYVEVIDLGNFNTQLTVTIETS